MASYLPVRALDGRSDQPLVHVASVRSPGLVLLNSCTPWGRWGLVKMTMTVGPVHAAQTTSAPCPNRSFVYCYASLISTHDLTRLVLCIYAVTLLSVLSFACAANNLLNDHTVSSVSLCLSWDSSVSTPPQRNNSSRLVTPVLHFRRSSVATARTYRKWAKAAPWEWLQSKQ